MQPQFDPRVGLLVRDAMIGLYVAKYCEANRRRPSCMGLQGVVPVASRNAKWNSKFGQNKNTRYKTTLMIISVQFAAMDIRSPASDLRTRDTATDALASKASACALGYFEDPYLLGKHFVSHPSKEDGAKQQGPLENTKVSGTTIHTNRGAVQLHSPVGCGVVPPIPASAPVAPGSVYRGPAVRRSPIMNRGMPMPISSLIYLIFTLQIFLFEKAIRPASCHFVVSSTSSLRVLYLLRASVPNLPQLPILFL
jgi:hypothetical protein